nr:Os03g0640825 [Ipomoea batatas]
MAKIPTESGPGFIPGIWTQSTAVPVAFERNSAKVSSAIERSLQGLLASLREC